MSQTTNNRQRRNHCGQHIFPEKGPLQALSCQLLQKLFHFCSWRQHQLIPTEMGQYSKNEMLNFFEMDKKNISLINDDDK